MPPANCRQHIDDEDDITGEHAPVYPPPLAPAQQHEMYPELTDREREVALALAQGSKNSEIADELGISTKTVDTHRAHVLKKLKCRNNVELCRLTIRRGYVLP